MILSREEALQIALSHEWDHGVVLNDVLSLYLSHEKLREELSEVKNDLTKNYRTQLLNSQQD